MNFQIINPYSLEVLAERQFDTFANACKKVDLLERSFVQWRSESFECRSEIIEKFQEFLQRNQEELAILITTDMGKPITESRLEVQKSIACCTFYLSKIVEIEHSLKLAYGYREPIGIVLGIMPWNFPLWQIVRYLIPALIVGNVCLIKPAFNTVRIAEFITKFFQQSKYPVVATAIVENIDAERLIAYKNIAGVSLTGSVRAGQEVGRACGENIKPCVLELGGLDPYIVCADSDIAAAITAAVKAKFMNNGQVCIAPKRFYFEAAIFDKALELFVNKTAEFLTYGDPLNEATTISVMARPDLKQNLVEQMNRANVSKTQIRYQHNGDIESANYYPAQIIDARNLVADNPLLIEEVFGPIAVCQSFEAIDEVISRANRTEFGLGASVWTNDKAVQNVMASTLEAGVVAINSVVTSDPAKPFGGTKKSGLGIELGLEGVLSFTNFKTIIRHC